MIEALLDDLRRDEAVRLKPYDDATGRELRPGMLLSGNITIGVGINLSGGLTDDEVQSLLIGRVGGVIAELRRALPWFDALSERRQRALANMAFNMGIPTLLKFKIMLAALAAGDFAAAAAAAGNSKWAGQVGARARRIIAMIEEG